jgi:hypothetical protein
MITESWVVTVLLAAAVLAGILWYAWRIDRQQAQASDILSRNTAQQQITDEQQKKTEEQQQKADELQRREAELLARWEAVVARLEAVAARWERHLGA